MKKEDIKMCLAITAIITGAIEIAVALITIFTATLYAITPLLAVIGVFGLTYAFIYPRIYTKVLEEKYR